MDSSSQETTLLIDDIPTHPAGLIVFGTDHILEEICSHLEFNDVKQFRLVSRTCNNEGRRALIQRDLHVVVVKSKDDDWQRELDNVLRNLEGTASAGGEPTHQQLLGWIFKRLALNNWKHSFGQPNNLLQQWGHYLRKIHLKQVDGTFSLTFTVSNLINAIHDLLTDCCPNLEEMMVVADVVQQREGLLSFSQADSVEFPPSPLLKLKCLRIKFLWVSYFSTEEKEVLSRFFAKLVIAAGTALETLEIDYASALAGIERRMLDAFALNVGVNNFQSLKELTLVCAAHVGNLSHTVQKSFPKLTKLILCGFNPYTLNMMVVAMRNPRNQPVFPQSFPALKSLTIVSIPCEYFSNWKLVYFLRHFPNLEVLNVSCTDEAPDFSDPIIMDPRCPCLQSLTFKTENYDLRLLRCAVNMFPNLVTLDLLEFGGKSFAKSEPEYRFSELIDIISPLNGLQHLYVNHAFHTPPQLVDAIQLTSNLTALETLTLCQTAHDGSKLLYNVSLYLTTSDPDIQYVLICDCVRRLHSIRLLNFRFATTREEMEEEAAAKGGHVSFGTIRHCHFDRWICAQICPKTCQSQH